MALGTPDEEDEAGLVHVSDAMPGISRLRVGDEFVFIDPSGHRIADDRTLARIRSLAVPPAYEKVWICPLENGHLQATGIDARARKQYRYHPKFRQIRDESKFSRLLEFAKALPRVHDRIARDLGRRGLPREKVLSAVVELLEKSCIRVGNEEYRKQNRSYGLTTLRTRQVSVEGSEISFSFLGKGKIKHRITLRDAKLARIVRKIQDLPGQELFRYVDDQDVVRSISSHDVNAYLHEIAGDSFTEKDFRTWAGTLLALSELVGAGPPKSRREASAAITCAIKKASRQLGNTPTICRKCYVHPAVLDAYREGRLQELLKGVSEQNPEELLVRLLQAQSAS